MTWLKTDFMIEAGLELIRVRRGKEYVDAIFYKGVTYRNKRSFIWDFKVSQGCVDCGYNTHHAALEFDHRPNTKKVALISRMPGGRYSWSDILDEISKCDIRCANCHKVRTSSEGAKGWNRISASSLGAPRKNANTQVRQMRSLREAGVDANEIAAMFGVSVKTVYRRLREGIDLKDDYYLSIIPELSIPLTSKESISKSESVKSTRKQTVKDNPLWWTTVRPLYSQRRKS